MTSYSSPEYVSTVDCTQLEKYLKARLWKMADMETRKLLYAACGMTDQKASIAVNQIPCNDLLAIDQLWMKYSNKRFGFSAQKALLQTFVAKYFDKTEAWNRFGDKVGWRINHLFKQNYWKKYSELTFTTEAPVGHFPHLGERFGILTVEAFSNHLDYCANAIAYE